MIFHLKKKKSTALLGEWAIKIMRNSILISVLECLICTKTCPMIAAEKQQVLGHIKAL